MQHERHKICSAICLKLEDALLMCAYTMLRTWWDSELEIKELSDGQKFQG